MRARESWLISHDHEKFAAAAVKCQNASGACIGDGRCHYGNCFGQDDEKRKREQVASLKRKAAEHGYELVKMKSQRETP